MFQAGLAEDLVLYSLNNSPPNPMASLGIRLRGTFVCFNRTLPDPLPLRLHLGLKGVKSAELLAFLETHDAETIYLVGDIIDQWVLGRNGHERRL